MADLLVPDGDTDRPSRPSSGARRPAAMRPASGDRADTRSADDRTDTRTDDGSGDGTQAGVRARSGASPDRPARGRRRRRRRNGERGRRTVPVELPMPVEPEGGWTVEAIEQAQFPTRMARRKALQSAQIEDLWAPDPLVTQPVLERVEDELFHLLDRHVDPLAPERPENDRSIDGGAGDQRGSRQPWAPDPVFDDRVDRALQGVDRPTQGRAGDLLPQARLASRTARRRLARRGAAAVVALACVAGLVTWGALRDPAQRPAPVAAAPAPPSQQLLAVALVQGDALTGLSLLAAGEGDDDQQVLVPSRLLLDVPGAGRLPVEKSLVAGPSAPGAAVADALDVRVSGTWVLSTTELARLVDAVGGIDADVDVDITQGASSGATILVSQGSGQHLGGAQAASYAQFLASGEPEAARLARQERVLTALLAGLPVDPDTRKALVSSGTGAPKGTTLDVVTEVTGALHDPARDRLLGSTVLPVRELDSGGADVSYGLDAAAAAVLVSDRLAGAAIAEPAGGRVRVLVQNGVGTPGLGDSARSLLVAEGMKYVGGGNVAGFGVTESVVVLADGTSVSRSRGLAVARALGLPDTALRVSDTAPTVADLVVVLGADFARS